MNSTEKILDFLEQLSDRSDGELRQIVPFLRPNAARTAVAAASTRVPTDHEQLDEWALAAAMFALSMRSDRAQAYQLVPLDITVAQLEADATEVAAAAAAGVDASLHDGSRTYIPPAAGA